MSITSRDSVFDTFFSNPGEVTANLSVWSAGMNTANTIIGVGIIGLPSVVRQFGILLGSFLIIFTGFMTFTSVYLMVMCKKESRYTNITTIANYALGKGGDYWIKIAIIINNWGTL